MALIVGGAAVETPFPSRNWRDDPDLRLAREDYTSRPRGKDGKRRPVQIITLHNTGNLTGPVLPGIGPDSSREESTVAYWRRKVKGASAHLIIDYNGDVAQCADLWSEVTWHASALNHRSIGVERIQRADQPNKGGSYEIQYQRERELCDWFMRLPVEVSVVQPAYPYETGVVDRIHEGGMTFYGVVGHCHQTSEKKRDPGPRTFLELLRAGYKSWRLTEREDLQAWERLQRRLGVTADGYPGQNTRRALIAAGYPDGLWFGDA